MNKFSDLVVYMLHKKSDNKIAKFRIVDDYLILRYTVYKTKNFRHISFVIPFILMQNT